MEPSKTPRRWLRFRLRTLLIMVTVLSVPLGWVGWELDQRRREKAAIAWVKEKGGIAEFSFHFENDERSWWEKTKDKWFGKRVRKVSLVGKQVSDLLPLKELKNLERLNLWATEVNDLSPLRELRNLKVLNLRDTNPSIEQVEKLKLVLPNCKIIFYSND